MTIPKCDEDWEPIFIFVPEPCALCRGQTGIFSVNSASMSNPQNPDIQEGQRLRVSAICYECGNQTHYRIGAYAVRFAKEVREQWYKAKLKTGDKQ